MSSYKPSNFDKWQDSDYFINRNLNDPLRIKQFKLDRDYIYKFIKSGNVCDVGCSTGEFMKFMKWDGAIYGMEINVKAVDIAKEFIDFDKNIFTEVDFFDVIVFRGTIQHVDIPFEMIKNAYTSLKKGGYLILLSTPNRDSLLYRIKKDLPLLEWKLNYFIPGAKDLKNALINYGFEVKDITYPYCETPYCNFIKDHLFFLLNIFSRKFHKHAFWGNVMNIVAKK